MYPYINNSNNNTQEHSLITEYDLTYSDTSSNCSSEYNLYSIELNTSPMHTNNNNNNNNILNLHQEQEQPLNNSQKYSYILIIFVTIVVIITIITVITIYK